MGNPIAIQVDHVTKVYKLYDRMRDRLKDSLGLTKEKCYQEHYALRDVSFSVQQGETLGIIGTNGAGKSTLLKIITGVLNQTEGDVTVNGKISALLELGAGFNMEYTGVENVYLNGTMMGFTDKEIDEKLPDILDFADIGDFAYQPVKMYSSGMFVRLAFAVAINIDPEILIVDEALSVGDVFFQSKCYRKFEEFKQAGKTILFVSHDMSSIMTYCDRAILLDHGKIAAEGSPKEVVNLYKQILVHQEPGGQEEQIPGDSHLTIPEAEGQHWIKAQEMNPDVLDYGDKRAEILGFMILDEAGRQTNAIEKGSTFTMKVRVLFHEEIEDPIFTYTIKDVRGTEITGTNTMFEKIEFEQPKENEIWVATYTQRADLQGGEYLVSFGLTSYESDELVVHHRLYDAGSLTIVSEKNTVGFYDMNSKITVEKEGISSDKEKQV